MINIPDKNMIDKRKYCNYIFDLRYQGGNVHAENMCDRLPFRKKKKHSWREAIV